MADRATLEYLSKKLADEGRLVEAGWVSMRVAAGLERAPTEQLKHMRMAFFAGAQHLMGSIYAMMEEGDEPTADDERRMAQINAELEAFINDFTINNVPTKGSA